MPITYQIDRERRLVITTGRGVITDADVFGYQQEVWSRPENSAYNELIDMTGVSDIEFISPDRVAKLAKLSSSMDAPGSPSKLAIIATSDLHFGLGRMYQSHREMAKQSTKAVKVCRSREAALEWLGVSIKPTP